MVIISTSTLVVLTIAAVLAVSLTINSTVPTGQRSENQICVNCDVERLRENAQNALFAIGCRRTVSRSETRAGRGQHVFNNGLLGFHRSVLQSLLREVGGYDEQLENLTQDLVIPLSRTQQNAISTMVVRFSPGEIYVDYNADVFGEYVGQLRDELVAYLRADTSVNDNERYGIQNIRQRVQFITTQMVNHVVYVDPMARDRWLGLVPRRRHEREREYNQLRSDIEIMFRNILQDFQKVSDKIKVFRRRNNWNWDRSDVK